MEAAIEVFETLGERQHAELERVEKAYRRGPNIAYVELALRRMRELGWTYKRLASRLGLSSISTITNWTRSGLIDQRHVGKIKEMDEFRGLEASHEFQIGCGYRHAVCWVHKNVLGQTEPPKGILDRVEYEFLYHAHSIPWTSQDELPDVFRLIPQLLKEVFPDYGLRWFRGTVRTYRQAFLLTLWRLQYERIR